MESKRRLMEAWLDCNERVLIIESETVRGEAHPLANAFGVGSSDWLGIWCDCLLARSLGRVMVGNQPPAPLLLHPYPGKPSVTGNRLAFVLPTHCREASLHSRVSIDAHLNVIGSDRLKFQITRREIRNHL